MRKLYQLWYFQVRTLSNIREKGVMIRLVIYRQIVSSPKMIVTQSCNSNKQSDREVELTTSRKMPTMIIRDHKKEAKHESVKIKRIV